MEDTDSEGKTKDKVPQHSLANQQVYIKDLVHEIRIF